MCLQETKIQNLDDGPVRSLGASRFFQWGELDSIGVVGGIFFFFKDSRVLELMDMMIGMFSILCRFRNREDGFQWTFSRVYGSVLDCNRAMHI